MKALKIFSLAAVALIAFACSNKTPNTEAEAPAALTVDAVLEQAPRLVDSLVTIEGVCTHTCRHGATKMFLIGTDDSHTIRVEACELGSFRPEVINSFVTVKGHLREQRIDEAYLANWEELLRENGAEEHGEDGAGCDTERAARGMESVGALDQIAEYRQRIADKVEKGENPWVSFYYVDAVEYEINE